MLAFTDGQSHIVSPCCRYLRSVYRLCNVVSFAETRVIGCSSPKYPLLQRRQLGISPMLAVGHFSPHVADCCCQRMDLHLWLAGVIVSTSSPISLASCPSFLVPCTLVICVGNLSSSLKGARLGFEIENFIFENRRYHGLHRFPGTKGAK